MSIKDFLKNQQYSGPKTGSGDGERTPFYKKKKGKQVGRLFKLLDGNVCKQYFEHQIDGDFRNKKVCPRTWPENSDECEYCNKAVMLYAEEEVSDAGKIRAKRKTWFCFVPLDADREHVPHILEVPQGAMQKLLLNFALQGGWQSAEASWDDEDFIASYELGVDKVFGEKAKDLIIDFDPKGKALAYKFNFSARLGRKVIVDTIPDFEQIFNAVKKIKNDDAPIKTKTKVKKKWSEKVFSSMTKVKLVNWCSKQKPPIIVKAKDSKTTILAGIKERLDG